MKRFIYLLLSIIIVLFCTCSCVKNNRHEGFEDFEEYVLNEMGEYLYFEKPEYVQRTDGDYHVIINMVFKEEYISDNDLVKQVKPIWVMEETRALINEYLNVNKDFIINDHYAFFHFCIASEETMFSQLPDTVIGTISNQKTTKVADEMFDGVFYVDYGEKSDWDYLSTCSDIKQINMNGASKENILVFVDNNPDVESILVNSDLIDELSELRPDIDFI